MRTYLVFFQSPHDYFLLMKFDISMTMKNMKYIIAEQNILAFFFKISGKAIFHNVVCLYSIPGFIGPWYLLYIFTWQYCANRGGLLIIPRLRPSFYHSVRNSIGTKLFLVSMKGKCLYFVCSFIEVSCSVLDNLRSSVQLLPICLKV